MITVIAIMWLFILAMEASLQGDIRSVLVTTLAILIIGVYKTVVFCTEKDEDENSDNRGA